jgi:hypothetical protein
MKAYWSSLLVMIISTGVVIWWLARDGQPAPSHPSVDPPALQRLSTHGDLPAPAADSEVPLYTSRTASSTPGTQNPEPAPAQTAAAPALEQIQTLLAPFDPGQIPQIGVFLDHHAREVRDAALHALLLLGHPLGADFLDTASLRYARDAARTEELASWQVAARKLRESAGTLPPAPPGIQRTIVSDQSTPKEP